MKFEKSGIICVIVEKEKNFGYWEVNPELKKAYFRDHGTLPPEDKDITDYSDSCPTIEEYLKHVCEVPHVKTIIPDRKIIFGDQPFCSWSKQRTSDDGVVTRVYCQHPALVSVVSSSDENKNDLFCGEHAPIGGGNSAANIPSKMFTSTASVKGK